MFGGWECQKGLVMLTLQEALMVMGGWWWEDRCEQHSGRDSVVRKDLCSSGKPTPDDFTLCHFGLSSLRDAKMVQFSKDTQYLSNFWSLQGTLGWHWEIFASKITTFENLDHWTWYELSETRDKGAFMLENA